VTLLGLVGDIQGTVLDGSMLLALPLAVLAGLVSFASPCVLPLVPGYLGYVSGMVGSGGARRDPVPPGFHAAGRAPVQPGSAVGTAGRVVGTVGRSPELVAPRSRVVAGVGLFVAGFTVVFVAFGVLAGSLGGLVAQWSDVLTRVLGVVVVGMGLVFIGWLPFAQRTAKPRIAPATGLWGAPVLGIVFGLGWTPCIGPTLVAVYTLALDEGSAGRGAALSVAYCLGLGLPFLLIALGFDRSARAVGFLRRHRLTVMRVGGGLLVLVGLALVTGLWSAFTGALTGLIGGFETVV
jgi:cytochrome c-type biogenesis protein